ncbi:TPA: hypothetical protein ACX8B0_001506 [Campylobacter jejuni]
MNLLVKNIKKTLKQYGHNFSSLKKENFSLSEELAFVFYSKYAQILIPFAPSAVKEFYDENDAWEELIYKFEGYLEYYEVLKALKVN